MMNKILLLINEYLPEFSANSSCVSNVVNELKKDNIVEILTFSGIDSLPACDILDDVKIHRVKCKMKSEYNKMYSQVHKMNPIYYAYKKIVNKLFVLFVWPDFVFSSISLYKKKALELINENRYDAVITSSGDFLVQTVGIYIKQKYPSIKWLAYFNDPMPCNNFVYLRTKFTMMNLKKKQELVLKYADAILYDLELHKKYINMFPNYKGKMKAVGIPSLIPFEDDKEPERNHRSINIVYAGFLYRNVRNPEFLLKLICNTKLPIKFDIYGSGDCLDMIETYAQISKLKIEYHGQVAQYEVRNKINDAGILVNICNIYSEQVPSKLFEYMATGLPILNIVKNDDDPIVEYIDKYKNGINIFEKSNIEQAVKQFVQFCENNAYKRVSFEETRLSFYKNTPEYTKNLINSLI